MIRLLLATMLMACGSRPSVVDHVITVPVKMPCARAAPPTFTHVPEPLCSGGRCSYAKLDLVILVENVEKLRQWVADTWHECSPGDHLTDAGAPR